MLRYIFQKILRIESEDKIMDNIKIEKVMEHVEVIINGIFAFSADNKAEAIKELKSQILA